MDLETHVRLSRFMIERCRRMVESGKDVFVLMDSLTRDRPRLQQRSRRSGRTMTAAWMPRLRQMSEDEGKGGSRLPPGG